MVRGFYLITPDWDDTARLLAVTEQALAAGVTLLQYRHKHAAAALRRAQAGALLALCRAYYTPLLINDDVDLCLALDADGVHVGGTDVAPAVARAALGPHKLVGASCYGDLALARQAEAGGASYVALGGFYPSPVKRYPVTTAPALVAAVKQAVALPCVVIGGMTPANAGPLVAGGADLVAAISSVYLAPDPAAAVRAFATLFDE